MATTVNAAFKEFMKDIVNLDPDVVSAARISRDNLLDNIAEFDEKDGFFDLYEGFNVHFGSFARKTKCRELDDIDLMIGIAANGATYNQDDPWDNVRITASTGKTTQKEVGMIGSHRFPMYRPIDKRVDIDYLISYLMTKRGKDILEAASPGGAGRNRTLGQDRFMNSKIVLPTPAEQKKIAEILSTQDKVIELERQRIDEILKVKQFFLGKMFPKKGQAVPEIRFKGFTGVWEQRKLGDIADIVGGGTPSTGNQSYWDGDIDWYAPAEIADQIYANSSQKKITGLGYENSSAKMLPPGTVLFTSRAGIGKTAILTRKGCTNQGFQSIVPHRGELDSYFIFSRTEELKRYGELVGAGSTFVEVSGKQMAVMELMMPPTMREQQTIGGFFQQLDHLITLHQRKLEEEKKKKKALMQLLLTGIVRV